MVSNKSSLVLKNFKTHILILIIILLFMSCDKSEKTSENKSTSINVDSSFPQKDILRDEIMNRLRKLEQKEKSDQLVYYDRYAQQINLKELINCTKNAFVTIESWNEYPQFSSCSRVVGSGFLIHPDGYVLTSAHVIERTTGITAIFNNGTHIKTDIVKVDFSRDIALLKLRESYKYHYLVIASDTDNIEVGDNVVAFGTPQGFQYTPSPGYITGKRVIEGVVMVQTNAQLNHGNSGGPLVNDQCKVVGMVSLKWRGEGLNFAIAVYELNEFLRRNY